MTSNERRAREAALEQVLDDIDRRLYPQVAEAVDFARLEAVQQSMVIELERLIAEGKLPAAPDSRAIALRAAAMIATAIYQLPQDPRRTKHAAAAAEQCRMLGDDVRVS